MNPGMDEKNKVEREFTEHVEHIIAGKDAEIDEAADDDYRSDIAFSRQIIECGEGPSASFQEGLKQRLLSRLAEKEIAEARRKPAHISFWDWLKNLVPRSPAWRTAAVTVTVAVVALVVVWGIGVLSPGEGPIVTLPPAVSVEVRASTAETAYVMGEEIDIHFSFKNVTDETTTFPFPPEIRIGDLGTDVVRTFDAGPGTTTLAPGKSQEFDLTWNQEDDAGKQVSSGDYQVIVPNVPLGEGRGMVSLVESPILTISNAP